MDGWGLAAGRVIAGNGRLRAWAERRTPISRANSLSSSASTTPEPSGSTAMNISSSDIPGMTRLPLPASGDAFRLARERGVDGSEVRGDSGPSSSSSGFANDTVSFILRFREPDIAPEITREAKPILPHYVAAAYRPPPGGSKTPRPLLKGLAWDKSGCPAVRKGQRASPSALPTVAPHGHPDSRSVRRTAPRSRARPRVTAWLTGYPVPLYYNVLVFCILYLFIVGCG